MMTKLSTRLFAILLLFTSTLISGSRLQADVVWEDELTDEQSITDNMVISADGTSMTFNRTVFSDSDGGTFDLAPVRSADFISFEATTSGNHTGYVELTFDNENDDPADFIELTINFAPAVTNLQFSLLDVDGNSNFAWDDATEVFVDGVNVKTNPAAYQLGPILFLDNETYMDGFEAGNAGASSTQTVGNIDFNFGSEVVSALTIRYFSTDDAISNPGSQFIGISDLQYVATIAAVPEPSVFGIVLMAGMAALLPRRRRLE